MVSNCPQICVGQKEGPDNCLLWFSVMLPDSDLHTKESTSKCSNVEEKEEVLTFNFLSAFPSFQTLNLRR